LVTHDMIENVLADAKRCRAATAAHHVTDTVKYANMRGYIERTIDRDYVWCVSTPQIFLTNLYRAAAYTAKKDGFAGTDDCSLAERLGFEVKLTEVGGDNIKITYSEDISRAEEILHRRKSEDSKGKDGSS
ncbi:MAG: 2-C-methyl-D-erythritol 4-phosphate cytidylyltransferase, partial [Firmicutes bacterium]|nr:2-C-methyl-D-erythritol 4-phosphate cytidylyltransferase [Bacillota bacterium]